MTEISPLLQQLHMHDVATAPHADIIQGKVGANEILFIKSGMGGAAIQTALSKVAQNQSPDIYMLTGFVSAADPCYTSGDIIFPQKLVAIDSDDYIPSYEALFSAETRARYPQNAVLQTVGRVYQKRDKKKLYSVYSKKKVIDMESGFFASWATVHAKKWCVVKAVSDTYRSCLPSSLFLKEFFSNTDERADLLRMVYRHPLDFYRLVQLNKNCSRAAHALAQTLAPLLGDL